jgi:hypothetical protein
MADIESPEDCPFHLGSALAPDLVEIGVVPQIFGCAGEAPVAV